MKSLLRMGMLLSMIVPAIAVGQSGQRTLLPIDLEHSAEFAWVRKPIHASRTLDGMRVLCVDMQMFRDAPAPTRNRLSSVNVTCG